MKFKKNLYLPLLSIIAIASCKKSDVSQNKQVTTPKADTDVYVVGNSGAANGTPVATYWKNGTAVKLVTDSSYSSTGRFIIIQPNADVYVAGNILGGDSNTQGNFRAAAYWKNGVMTRLDNSAYYSDAFGIALIGNDVYVGGFTSADGGLPSATYWKNNAGVKLPLNWQGSDVYAMATNGTDVFFAGDSRTDNINYFYVPTYWKNSEDRTVISGSANTTYYGQVNAVIVNGNDIYTACTVGQLNTNPAPAYSKNGVITLLSQPNGHDYDQATGIATNGTDVYVVGFIQSTAMYWKNGTPYNLTDGSANCEANAIVLSGNNVYIAGTITETNGKQTACYWKNGVQVKLPKGANANAQGLGIAVVTH